MDFLPSKVTRGSLQFPRRGDARHADIADTITLCPALLNTDRTGSIIPRPGPADGGLGLGKLLGSGTAEGIQATAIKGLVHGIGDLAGNAGVLPARYVHVDAGGIGVGQARAEASARGEGGGLPLLIASSRGRCFRVALAFMTYSPLLAMMGRLSDLQCAVGASLGWESPAHGEQTFCRLSTRWSAPRG